MSKIDRIIIVLALLWMYGTLGSFDTGRILFAQAAAQILLGAMTVYLFAIMGWRKLAAKIEGEFKALCMACYYARLAKRH